MLEFVAEQYVSKTDTAAGERGAVAARAAAEQLSREGTAVEFVRSILIREDETCLYIYRADSIGAVVAALRGTGMRFERVAEAVTGDGEPPGIAGETK